jgi:hypothetical protein
MGVLQGGPVIGKDRLEDAPVPRGLCHHRVAPSWGVGIVAVERLYHASSAASPPQSFSPWHPRPTRYSLSHGDLWD